MLRLLIPLLPTLLRLLPTDQGRERARRLVVRGVMSSLAAVLAIIAFGFAIGSLYLALATMLTPPAAAAVVALALLIFAMLLVLIGVLVTRRPPRPPVVSGSRVTRETVESAGLAAILPLIRHIERKPLESILVAGGLGVLVALLSRRR